MVLQMSQMLGEVVEALRGRGTWNAPGFSGLDVPLGTTRLLLSLELKGFSLHCQ